MSDSKILKFLRFLLQSLYEWTLRWAATSYAGWGLCLIAFAESSFFPIPPDILLIAMVLSRPAAWWRYALIATFASVFGGMFGYFIGWSFYQTIGQKIVEFYGLQETVKIIGLKYSAGAFLTVFTAAFTPIPYKVITITAGLFQIPFPTLIIASLIGRGGRFFIVSILLRIFGERIKNFIDKYFNILSLIFVVLLVGGFIVIKFLL